MQCHLLKSGSFHLSCFHISIFSEGFYFDLLVYFHSSLHLSSIIILLKGLLVKSFLKKVTQGSNSCLTSHLKITSLIHLPFSYAPPIIISFILIYEVLHVGCATVRLPRNSDRSCQKYSPMCDQASADLPIFELHDCSFIPVCLKQLKIVNISAILD